MVISGKTFAGRTYVMAIINITPDSFWADSRAMRDDALFAAEKAIGEGAAVLDIGAQSTRPGYCEIPAEEEIARLERVLPAICALGVPVSVDTYFPEVAEFALQAGAGMINDVWGLTRGGMADAVARHGAAVCIMHNSAERISGDVFPPVESFLKNQAEVAVRAGISADKICLDGGVGFAKSAEQSLRLVRHYDRLGSLGYPLLLGCSRKSLFGGSAQDRLPKTLAATRSAAERGILFVRVHDVKENLQEINKVYENLYRRP